jgi:AmmeMemoRadiSam system protein B
MNTRHAVMEGRFYPSSRQKIFDQLKKIELAGRYPEPDMNVSRIFGGVLPHAGHIYSGHQTIPFFRLIRKLGIEPETFVIVHPNHTGNGIPVAIDDADFWTNSIGEVPVDREFGLAMEIPFDSRSHAHEHAAEVIVPYVQYYFQEHPFSILPVCMKSQDYGSASLVAERIHQAVRETGRKIMLLASCDFSHFLSPDEGEKMDQYVVDEILSRNMQGVESAVNYHHISICGYGPIMVLMCYSASIDPGYRIKILARGNSGEVIPSREVVDYISLIIYQ